MKLWKRYTVVLAGLALLSSGLWATSASAKPKKDKGSQTIYVVPAPTSSVTSVTQTTTQLITFTSYQRTVLYDLLHGSNTTLIPRTTLVQIVNQRASLPPGIRKQLLRGKGLPPGIAKKIPLSTQVIRYLDLPATYNIFVVGSNVVLFNTVTGLVSDCIYNIL
jgi:hypothetical protein